LHSGSRTAFVLIAAALLTLAVAPAAGAKGKKKQKLAKIVTATASATAQPGDGPLTATATCPTKKTAIGGGYVALPKANDTGVFPLESRRVGSTQWRVTLFATVDAGATQPLTVEVYCAKLRGRVVEGNSSGVLAGAHRAQAGSVASCPAKSRLLSGGFQLLGANAPPSIGLVHLSARAGNGWQAGVVRAVQDGPEALIASAAYCLRPAKKKGKSGKRKPKDPKALLDSSLTVPLGPDTNDDHARPVLPPCAPRRQLISGGFSAPAPTGDNAVPLFYESRRGPGSWVIGAVQAGSDPGAVTAYEYCG
jgi:hypothetical protein